MRSRDNAIRNLLRRSLGIFVSVTTLAVALMLVASAPTSAATTVPRTSTYTDPGPDYLSIGTDFVNYPSDQYAGDWTKYDTDCGGWRCGGNHSYFTSLKGATAWWHLGDVQGQYRLDIRIPKGENEIDKRATARLGVQVREKRPGETRYTTLKSYTLDQGTWNHNGGWIGWSTYVHLDGEVFVRVEVLSGYAGVSDVRMSHKDVLPAHKELATEMCLVSGARQRNIALAIYYGIIGSIATAGIGAGPSIAAGIASAGISATALEYLIEQRAELQEYGACKYQNELFSWIHSYMAFSDDIAVLTANNQPYESLGKSFCLSRGANVSKQTPVTTDDTSKCS